MGVTVSTRKSMEYRQLTIWFNQSVEMSSSPDIDPILAAAEIEFATHGFAGARVDRIAERAGVNKATLYYRIGDKERLYALVLRSTIDRALASLREAVAASPAPDDQMRAVVAIMAGAARSNPHFPSLMLREIAGGGTTLPPEVLERFSEAIRIIAGILEEGRKQGEFRRTDPLITHMIITGSILVLSAGIPLRKKIRRRLRLKGRTRAGIDEDFADEITSFILAGLAAPRHDTEKHAHVRKRS